MKKSMIVAAAICVMTAGVAAAQDAKLADSKTLFESKCKACHGVDGKGDTTMRKRNGAKDYTDPKVQDALKDDVAFKSIKEGLKKDDKALMQPAAGMTDDQIKGLVAYMRTLKKK